jgi:hypothetical protein
VLIAPQGPVDANNPNFGNLHEPGGFAALVFDVLSLLYRDGFIDNPVVGDVVLESHSGGYEVTHDILLVGGLPISAVHLFDSLYGLEDAFESFALAGGVLRSNYTGGSSLRHNYILRRRLDRQHQAVGRRFSQGDLTAFGITIGRSRAHHVHTLVDGHMAQRWLWASGLRPLPEVPPVMALTRSAPDGQALVQWQSDPGVEDPLYEVLGSRDGEHWKALTQTRECSVRVPLRPYLSVVRVLPNGARSARSDVYGATGDDWLVVDGFDGAYEGAWRESTHPFAAELGNAIGYPFSVASNEAVVEGRVELDDFDGVLWFVGDEGERDVTFNRAERRAISDYLAAGGRLVVSGANVAEASRRSFRDNTLHIGLLGDDAETDRAGGYRFGEVYEVTSPDVLAGDEVLWRYDTGRPAAVGWEGRLAVVGFPLETLAEGDRAHALGELAKWLSNGG